MKLIEMVNELYIHIHLNQRDQHGSVSFSVITKSLVYLSSYRDLWSQNMALNISRDSSFAPLPDDLQVLKDNGIV